jgi:peptidyl-dipeptidase A
MFQIPSNVPYMRYFLAHVLQFQFYRGLCREAGHQGPLYECDFYQNKDAGKRYSDMLSLGSSKPWPEALKAATGEDQLDASAMVEYFGFLLEWLKDENKEEKCGW